MVDVPPGNESQLIKEQQIQEELLGFLKNESLPDFSHHKGASYIYKMSNFSSTRGHLYEQLKASNSLQRGLGLGKLPEVRYPVATRRIFGQVNPGEFERRARKTSDRKQTRGEVEMLCRMMLFKKKKFTPGKMV